MKKFLLRISLLLVSAVCMCGCSSDDGTYSTYSHYKASFSYTNVLTTAPLKNSLVSPGEFCTIRLTLNKRLLFKSLYQTEEKDVTAAAYYQSFKCLSGFIAGLANVPDPDKIDLTNVCYDLACPNCFKDDAISRDLTLQESGYAYCPRCKRKYNLNMQGLVCGGSAGKPLERYHIHYDGANTMTIYN